jgi:hypothetical protein
LADDDLLKEGREKFGLAQDAENDNRAAFEFDMRFGRHEEQWPAEIKAQRERDGRPCLTINKLTAFSRQVVNDARQNKPSIKVHPADSGADPDTAEVINGLIRNIEYTSNADVAYDTAVDNAVNGGWGYIRVGLDYAYDDSFDMDLTIERVANPLSVYGDPNSTEADSCDWLDAFVVDRQSQDQFKAQYGKTKTIADWDDSSWWDETWREQNDVLVAEWWHREESEIQIAQFLNVQTGALQTFSVPDIEEDEDIQLALAAGLLQFKRQRTGKTYKVEQRIMTGAEVIRVNKWAGCYIPIIPVYGDEYNIKGKRYFRSLIHPAIDAQRQFNYWRSASTELVALAPKTPFIGRKGAFNSDIDKWNTANKVSHPFLEYDGADPPQRQPLDVGPAAGALQEALNAADDMKSTIGLYDASLGARSNETSGVAINARQREGDVSTFHFIDNMTRAIRHTGRVLIDLIPKVYTGERIIRVLGEDGKPQNVPLGQQYQKTNPKTGQPMTQPQMGPNGQPMNGPDGNPLMQPILAMHDFSVGKYDLTVQAGPSYTTQREEVVASMTALMQAYPPAAPIVGPEMIRNQDWPGAEKMADKLEAMADNQIPPQVQNLIEQGKQQIADLMEKNQQLTAKVQQLTADKSAALAKVQQAEFDSQRKAATSQADNAIKASTAQANLDIQGYDAETRRIAALASAVTAITPPPITNADAPRT